MERYKLYKIRQDDSNIDDLTKTESNIDGKLDKSNKK